MADEKKVEKLTTVIRGYNASRIASKKGLSNLPRDIAGGLDPGRITNKAKSSSSTNGNKKP